MATSTTANNFENDGKNEYSVIKNLQAQAQYYKYRATLALSLILLSVFFGFLVFLFADVIPHREIKGRFSDAVIPGDSTIRNYLDSISKSNSVFPKISKDE